MCVWVPSELLGGMHMEGILFFVGVGGMVPAESPQPQSLQNGSVSVSNILTHGKQCELES